MTTTTEQVETCTHPEHRCVTMAPVAGLPGPRDTTCMECGTSWEGSYMDRPNADSATTTTTAAPAIPRPNLEGSLVELENAAALDFGRACRNAAVVASRDLARPILCRASVEIDATAGTVQLIATDSYRLLVDPVDAAAVAADAPASVQLDRDALVAIGKATKAVKRGGAFLRITATAVELTTEAGTASWRLSEPETFPAWRQLIPEADPGEMAAANLVGYNAKYLGDLAKLDPGHDADFGTVRCEVGEGMKPGRFSIGRLTYLLMPVRIK